MKRATWTFLLFVLAALFCTAAIPLTDLPETAYDEVDTPINQSPPVVPGIRLVRPAQTPVIIPAEFRQHGVEVKHHFSEPASHPPIAHYGSRSAQEVLCVLII